VEYIEKILDADPDLARAELKVLGHQLRRQLEDVRAFITQLRPPAVDQAGLSDAIEAAVRQLEANPGLSASMDLAAGTGSLTDGQRIVVLRIAQEALQNVRKHAEAAHVAVVTRSDDAAWVLEVRDDGHGFDLGAGAARGGRNFGLQFMRERAELIGAQLDVRSGRDGGTIVRLAIPTGPAMGAEESR
jgi:signal transduction histidine kinase